METDLSLKEFLWISATLWEIALGIFGSGFCINFVEFRALDGAEVPDRESMRYDGIAKFGGDLRSLCSQGSIFIEELEGVFIDQQVPF